MISETLTPVTIEEKHPAKFTTIKNGQYQLRDCLEQNPIYQTYQGLNLKSNKLVIIHSLSFSLRSHSEFNHWKKQFLYYTILLRSCHHSSLPKILDCFDDNDHPYLVYEYYSGISLEEIIERKKQGLSPKDTIKYIKPVIQALRLLHKKGLIHQNIQPRNIILNQEKNTIMLLNFGFYFHFTPPIQQFYPNILTNNYSPLEHYQTTENPLPTTDIYGLSATLFYLLTGSKPLSIPQRNQIPWQQWHTFSPQFPESIRMALLKGLIIPINQRCQNLDQWFALITKNYAQNPSMKTAIQFTEISTPKPTPQSISEVKSIRFTNFDLDKNTSQEENIFDDSNTIDQDIETPPSLNSEKTENSTFGNLINHQNTNLNSYVNNYSTVNTGVKSVVKTQPQPKNPSKQKKSPPKAKSHHLQELKQLVKFMLLTGLIAISGGFGFAYSLMVNQPSSEDGITILDSEQTFPPRQNWPISTTTNNIN
jgi:eukaryotic-like serine/threonine-protein kinase